MNKTIALFRGINVGGNNILPMKDLKTIMSECGLQNVQSYIQSGNVVFSTEQSDKTQLSQQLRQLVLNEFGFEPKVMLINEHGFREKVPLSPFDINEDKIVHLYFLSQTPDPPEVVIQ